MFHLRNVLQLIIDGLNNCPLPEQKSVRDAHQGTFHITLEFCYQLYAVHEQPLEKILAYVSLVTHKFPIDELNE